MDVAFEDTPEGEKAIDELSSEMDRILKMAERRLEKLRQKGFNALFIFGTYDQLTNLSFVHYASKGDPYAIKGMVDTWMKDRS